MFKKYRIGFEWRGLVLFLAVMLPNFIWFTIPAPNDILRVVSRTPVTDTIATICQVAFIICLCLLIRTDQRPFRINGTNIGIIALIVAYYICWILYYQRATNIAVIIGLTIFPCIAFLLFAIDRRNTIAVIPIILFTMCHLMYAAVNFIA